MVYAFPMEKEKALHFWTVYVDTSKRLAWVGFGLSSACALIFFVLMRQGLLPDVYPIVTILSASLAVFFLLAGLLGLYGKHRLKVLNREEK